MATHQQSQPPSDFPAPSDEKSQISEVTKPAIEAQQASTAQETAKVDSMPSVFVNSEPIREDQIQNAIKFLSHPRVRGSPVIHRRSFLERKGLTKEEIDEAFRRVPDPPPSSQTTVTSQDFKKMQKFGDFKLPQFFNYPPYFTLQPVRDTREKQIQLWKELILDYCKTHKVFLIGVEEDFPLFSNSSIDRTLSHEARETFLSAIVGEGRAEWLDKGHRKCLILWHRIQDWSDIILQFVRDNGLEDSVMTVEEISSGTESHGTELQGIDRTILMRALKLLENKGKLALFKGTSADDEGVKFSV